MGGWTLWIGLTSGAMPSASGWQAEVSSRLQHWGSVIERGLDRIPSWAAAVALLLLVALLARRAIRQLVEAAGEGDGEDRATGTSLTRHRPAAPEAAERQVEHEYV